VESTRATYERTTTATVVSYPLVYATSATTEAHYPRVDPETNKLADFLTTVDFDSLDFDLHTPSEAQDLSSMWHRMEDTESEAAMVAKEALVRPGEAGEALVWAAGMETAKTTNEALVWTGEPGDLEETDQALKTDYAPTTSKVGVAEVEGHMMARTLDELVDFLDLPGKFEDPRDDFRYTNHCTTFGTEDMWPI
jgi:hypothetical protein